MISGAPILVELLYILNGEKLSMVIVDILSISS